MIRNQRFFRIYHLLAVYFVSFLLQSCATTDEIRYTKNPIAIINAPFEIALNVLESPVAILPGGHPDFSFSKENQLNRSLRYDDYRRATKLVNKGVNIGFKYKGKRLPVLAAQCEDISFSRAIVERPGALPEFQEAVGPKFKQAIENNDKVAINRYLQCGYPLSSSIDSKPLVYWAGFYMKQDLTGTFDPSGKQTYSYRQGIADGRDYRIHTALGRILSSHVIGHTFKGGNILTAMLNEGAARVRSVALQNYYHEVYPELSERQVKVFATVTALWMDGKLSIDNVSEKYARSLIEEEINKIEPGMGTFGGFVYGTINRLEAARNK